MLALVRRSSVADEGEPVMGASYAVPSFEEVYAEHFAYVWKSARRLGVRERELEDVVQDVFITVHRLLPAYEPRSAIRGWLYAIVARTVMHHHRTHRRRTAAHEHELDGEIAERVPDEGALGPEASVAESEQVRILEQVLDDLDPEKRAVVVLAAFEHKSTAEIAAILELNPKTVGSRLRAAREQIHAALERHKVRDTWRVK